MQERKTPEQVGIAVPMPDTNVNASAVDIADATNGDVDEERAMLFSHEDTRRYNKAQRWRFANRILALTGVCVVLVVVACVVSAIS